jgi:hypothetical protein
MKAGVALLLLALGAVVPSGVVRADGNPRLEPVPPAPPAVTGEAPAELLQRLRADLAQRSGHKTQGLAPIRDEAVAWSDGALGCPRFGETYAQLPTRGWWVVFTVDGREYDYRVDGKGRFRLCENPRPPRARPAPDDTM